MLIKPSPLGSSPSLKVKSMVSSQAVFPSPTGQGAECHNRYPEADGGPHRPHRWCLLFLETLVPFSPKIPLPCPAYERKGVLRLNSSLYRLLRGPTLFSLRRLPPAPAQLRDPMETDLLLVHGPLRIPLCGHLGFLCLCSSSCFSLSTNFLCCYLLSCTVFSSILFNLWIFFCSVSRYIVRHCF